MSSVEPSIAPRTGTTESSKLHRRALGVPDLMFFIIAASAPLTAVAGGQAATYLVTGNRAVAFMFIPLGIVLALFATSLFAALLSFHNAVARYAFALGREGMLPSVLGRVNTVVLPLILFGGGIVGAVLKRSRPVVYERIGGGADAEE